MSTNYSSDETITIPYEYGGKTFLREIVISGEYLNRAVNTPSRMVQFEGAQSTVAGFEDHTVLNHFEYGISRETNPNVSVGYQGDGKIRMNNIVFVIPYDDSIPSLTRWLRTGRPLEQISFKTLMWTGGENPEILSEHVFGNCYLISWHPARFCHLFVARADEWMVHTTSFGQTDATAKGQNADAFNFRTNSEDVAIVPGAEAAG